MGNKVDPGDYAAGWDKTFQQHDHLAFRNNVEARKSWVVLLEFFRNGSNSIGTGFFINIPGSKKDIILTAGHNLHGSKDMKVTIIEAGKGPDQVSVEPEDFRICPSYPSNKIDDYGVILLPKKGRPGFGFNFRFASQGLGEMEKEWDPMEQKLVTVHEKILQLHITGYMSRIPGSQFDNQGELITKGNERLRPDQVEYAIETVEGVSGSPVWRVDKGGETVVAVHNNGPRGPGRGSRGTRLNDKVLRQIFKWAEVEYESKALKVHHPKADAKGGLYLQFCPDDDDREAYLGVGPDSPETRFDVLPVYTRPGKLDPNLARYAFFYRAPSSLEPGKGKWVKWIIRDKEGIAELTNKIKDSCMVTLRDMPKNDGSFKIVIEREATDEEKKKEASRTMVFVELKVDDSMLKEGDIKRAKDKGQIAQVQGFMEFIAFKLAKPLEFNVFCMK